MTNTKAYTIPVGQIFSNRPSGQEESSGDISSVAQTSPAWVLTFVRWEVRDPLRTPDLNPSRVRDYLIVENDCVSLNITDSKSVLTPSFDAILKETDTNYETAIKPGDFCFINIVNSEEQASDIVRRAKAGKPINNYRDGFKGFFKIQGCRRNLEIDTETGTKMHFYKINGFAFTEFNNIIYFNPNLVNRADLQNQGLYIEKIATTYASLIKRNGVPYSQELIAMLIQSFIGTGVNPKAKQVAGLITTPNSNYQVPYLVGRLLGVTHSITEEEDRFINVTAAKDLYHYLFGIQQYNNTSPNISAAKGLNPSNINGENKYPGFYYTDKFVEGYSTLKAEYWNQVKLWSILNQYVNSPLNEFYTCFRMSPNGKVMPTVVLRQMPFTSEEFYTRKFNNPSDQRVNGVVTTRFLTLPRWKIDPSLVFSLDLGTDEAARINFVQYYARSAMTTNGLEISQETAQRNYIFDDSDIKRSGLRPYVIQNVFDERPDTLVYSAPIWARIIGDAVIGGHLKLNGTVRCIGISEPIAVGDNLEFENVVYHIEQISHICSINPNGIKEFRTIINLSNGVSVNSSANGTRYASMSNVGAKDDLESDYKNGQILPGISQSQNLTDSKILDTPGESSDPAPFPQPNLNKGKIGT